MNVARTGVGRKASGMTRAARRDESWDVVTERAVWSWGDGGGRK